MGVSNPISSTERSVAQIIRTYVGENYRKRYRRPPRNPEDDDLAFEHGMDRRSFCRSKPEVPTVDRMKFQVAILNRVIIIVQCVLWAIFILYANCIYM